MSPDGAGDLTGDRANRVCVVAEVDRLEDRLLEGGDPLTDQSAASSVSTT
jgi:hypothetical protein